MKVYNIIAIFALFFVLCNIHSTSAEISLWQQTNINNDTQIVNYHGYYQLDDTSNYQPSNLYNTEITSVINFFITRVNPQKLSIWATVQGLPYNISSYYPQYANAIVDWCNLTIQHNKNIYDSNGNIINTTTEIINQYFENTYAVQSPRFDFKVYDKDSIIADMDCHYTNPQTLFIDSVLFGQFATYIDAQTCARCEVNSIEETINLAKQNEAMANKQQGIYLTVEKVVRLNYQIWNIGIWIVKIGLIFVALGLVFAGMYFFYYLLKDVIDGRGKNG